MPFPEDMVVDLFADGVEDSERRVEIPCGPVALNGEDPSWNAPLTFLRKSVAIRLSASRITATS